MAEEPDFSYPYGKREKFSVYEGKGTRALYFSYGDKETEYLKAKDRRLGEVIDEVGHINRETGHDLFSAVVHQIIGQQISTKAQATVWKRIQDACVLD